MNGLKQKQTKRVGPKESTEKSAKNSVSRISAARKAAFEILLKVADEKAKIQVHADDLLRSHAVEKLAPADRNLVTTLVLGVLRWQIALDAEIRKCLTRPNAKLDLEVLIALRMGAFQLLHLDRIPAHAAVHESVEQVRESGHPFAVGMANAVLRKIQATQTEFKRDSLAQAIAAHPAWMFERWVSFYGREVAEAICLHGQEQPQLTVRLTDEFDENALSGKQLAPSEILAAGRFVEAGEVVEAEETSDAVLHFDGEMRIQDEGSQLVGEIAAAVFPAGSEKGKEARILDCCAAPGGKTLILAERVLSARIFAGDASTQRLENLRKRFEKFPKAMRDRIECAVADATDSEAKIFAAQYDLILADVPCSGTGTLGRNPEIRHRLTVEEIERQAVRQCTILKNALGALALGGRLVYSTCSLEPEENEKVVGTVLDELTGKGKIQIRQINIADSIAMLEKNSRLRVNAGDKLRNSVTLRGNLLLFPSGSATDGFFVSVLERVD